MIALEISWEIHFPEQDTACWMQSTLLLEGPRGQIHAPSSIKAPSIYKSLHPLPRSNRKCNRRKPRSSRGSNCNRRNRRKRRSSRGRRTICTRSRSTPCSSPPPPARCQGRTREIKKGKEAGRQRTARSGRSRSSEQWLTVANSAASSKRAGDSLDAPVVVRASTAAKAPGRAGRVHRHGGRRERSVHFFVPRARWRAAAAAAAGGGGAVFRRVRLVPQLS